MNYVQQVKNRQIELNGLLNEFLEIHDKDKIKLARSLVAQEGNVDLKSEGLKTSENQRDLSIKFRWGHNHRFNNKFVVGGKMRDRHINLMAQFQIKYNLSKDYFVNKNVIDIGCWTGGTTLLLKALGANEILALEEVQKYATTATTLISDIYEQKNVTCNGGNVYNLETDKKYDVAYFPGVIYHLSDPILALRRVFNSLKDGGEIYIESMGLNNDNSICKFSGNARGESDRDLTDKKGWNWFIPSSLCLKNWLIEAGFREVDCFFSDASKQLGHGRRVYGYGKRKKYVDITRAGFSRPDVE